MAFRYLLAASILALAIACRTTTMTETDDMARAAAEQQELLDEVNRVAHEIEDRTRAARERGNLLTEVEALRELDAESQESSEMVRGVLALRLCELSARLGNYDDAILYAARGEEPADPAVDPALEESLRASTPTPAIEAVRKLAGSRQVIMINEAHHDPRHRAFILQLLGALREEGFQYFAAETFYESDTGLAERGYPTAASGSYTAEPVFGILVRTAIRLGYTLVPYESSNSDSADERERGQAANLKARILDANPQAKILVHAGYGHVYKAALPGVIPMAVRFHELTGIEPYSIDQTVMTENASPELEQPLFRLAIEEGWVREPTIFVCDGAAWSLSQERIDATLFHPRARLDQGRPTWLALSGRRRLRPVPTSLVPEGVHVLVRAWPAGEPPDAVPVDQVEIRPGSPRPALYLEAGNYRVVAESVDGVQLGDTVVQVP